METIIEQLALFLIKTESSDRNKGFIRSHHFEDPSPVFHELLCRKVIRSFRMKLKLHIHKSYNYMTLRLNECFNYWVKHKLHKQNYFSITP